MKNIKLIGKCSGVYEGVTFYQLFFAEPIEKQRGEGVRPYQRRTVYDGSVRTSPSVGCTDTVYNFVVVDEVYDSDTFLFNTKGKLAGFDS